MKIRLRDGLDFDAERLGGWLIRGQDYVVLSVEQYSADEAGYRVASEDNELPVVFKASLFDVVDNRLPGCWRLLSVRGSAIDLGPEAFGEAGFWERFFNREPAALDVYRRTKEDVTADS